MDHFLDLKRITHLERDQERITIKQLEDLKHQYKLFNWCCRLMMKHSALFV